MIDEKVSFKEYLNSFKQTLKSVFYERDDVEKFALKRGFPALVLRDIMAHNPLSVAIPSKFGGRGANVKECLGVLEAASYESLPLSLTFGINMALFLEPVAKYANEGVKEGIFDRFLNRQNMGGLMITEPDFGSDALGMQTYNTKQGSNYHIKGTKHWQGLTGMADYWLMTSRPKLNDGSLGRDIDFFVVDVQQPGQQIHVEEYYNNIGLYAIPYGKNKVDVTVPQQYKLNPETTGIKLLLDLLHRSRLQFPGMGMGFIKRMLDEAVKHVNSRIVGGKALMALDQVQHQISRLQSAFTVNSAMCAKSTEMSGIENDLSMESVQANSMKAYVTDLMQEAAQTLTQLSGANGYKKENIGSRGIVDSRPFRIFEGSNEMLYTQISEVVLKLMRRNKEANLSGFLKDYSLTNKAADFYKHLLDFPVDFKLPQRKLVDLGKIISKVVSANNVVDLGIKGFQPDLINQSLETIKHEITQLVSSFKFQNNIKVIDDYNENSSWLAFS